MVWRSSCLSRNPFWWGGRVHDRMLRIQCWVMCLRIPFTRFKIWLILSFSSFYDPESYREIMVFIHSWQTACQKGWLDLDLDNWVVANEMRWSSTLLSRWSLLTNQTTKNLSCGAELRDFRIKEVDASVISLSLRVRWECIPPFRRWNGSSLRLYGFSVYSDTTAFRYPKSI